MDTNEPVYVVADDVHLIIEDEQGVARTYGPGDPVPLSPEDADVRMSRGQVVEKETL